MKYKKYIGKKVSFIMKPTLMRDWIIVKDTGKCLAIKKERDKGVRYHLPKKCILDVYEMNG
jgi:hypothetical protein